MNSGRAGLAWMLASLFAGALLAVVVLGWLPERTRSASPDSLTPTSNDSSALTAAIEKLDQRVARIEAALAVQDSRGTRERVHDSGEAAGPHEPPASDTADRDQLHKDLLLVSKHVEALADSLKDGRKPGFLLPSLEQMRAGRRDVDWAFVEEVRQLWNTNEAAALERVRLMSFDDLLRKVGVPTGFRDENGDWVYTRSVTTPDGDSDRGIQLHFARDYVTGVYGIGAD